MGSAAEWFAVIDQNVAANVRARREAQGLSQGELAQLMVERGFGFSQATVWKIEQGKRPVKFSEARALADALQLWPWLALERDPRTFHHEARLEDARRRLAATYNGVKTAVSDYLHAQAELAVEAAEMRDGGLPVSEQRLGGWLSLPAEQAVIEARVEYTRDEEVREEQHKAVEAIMQALRDNGYDPSISLDDVVREGPADVLD